MTNDSGIYRMLSTKAPRFPGPELYLHRLSGTVQECHRRYLLRFVGGNSRLQLLPPRRDWSGKRIRTGRTECPDCESIEGGVERPPDLPPPFLQQDVAGSLLQDRGCPPAKRKFLRRLVCCCPRRHS